MFNVGPVFHANYQSTAQIVVNQGGTDSGKTYALIQVLFTFATTTKPPLVDPIITVVGESIPNLKKGAYRTAKNVYATSPQLQAYIRTWNETDRTIYFKNGWIMEFTSYESEQQAKQGKRQYLFVNEAQSIPWLIFWQLAKRTRIRTFIDYNPTAPFWAHDNLIGTDPTTNDLSATVQLIISDHRHNPFLSAEEHARTEGIKDKELWRVYARGLTGNITGLIFPSWQKIPDADYPWNEPFIGGQDWGYTNDPSASVRICRIGDSIFAHELAYETALSAPQLHKIYTVNGFTAGTPIYADHDPDMIVQCRRLGLLMLPARKGQGSINAGILMLNKQFKVFYTASSTNIDFERKRYIWINDPTTGKPTNTAIDGFDHALSCVRYAAYTHYFKQTA